MQTKIEEDYAELLAYMEFITKGNEETFWEDFYAQVEEAEQRGW